MCLCVCEYGDVGVAKVGCVMDVKQVHHQNSKGTTYVIKLAIIGTSLSEARRVCMSVCWWPYTVNFKCA